MLFKIDSLLKILSLPQLFPVLGSTGNTGSRKNLNLNQKQHNQKIGVNMNNGRILTTLIVLLLVSTGCATAPLTKDWGFMTAKDREYHRYTKLETFAEKPAHGNSVKFEGEGCAFLWIWRTPENAHKNPGPSPTYVVEITEEKPWVSLPVPESDFGTVIIGVDDFGNPTTTGQRYLWESILKTDDRLSVNGHTCDQIDEAIYQKFFKD